MNQPVPLRGQLTVQPAGMEGANTASRAIQSVGEGLQQTFRMYDQVGEQLKDMGTKMMTLEQQTKLTKAEVGLSGELAELKDKYSQRQDWDVMGDDFKKDSQELVKRHGQDLQGQYALKFQHHVMSEVGSAYNQVKSAARKGKIDTYKASLGDAEELYSRKAASAGYGTKEHDAARADYLNQIAGALALGVVTNNDAFKMQQKFDEKVAAVAAKQVIIADPLKAHAMLRDPNMFPQLDPMKRLNMQEEALTHARQIDMQREREENRAERLQNKMEKQRGAAIVAKAATAEVTLPELRQNLRDGKISVSDFNHAQTLIKQGLNGPDFTDMNQYMRMYEATRSGSLAKDDIVNATNIAPKDKIKLLDQYHKVESGTDKLEKPIHKNNREIIRATLKPGGFMAPQTPEREQAHAYAVEQYDSLVKRGVDPTEAREKAMATWEKQAGKMGGGINKPPTVGTPDMDEATFLGELDRAFEAGQLTKQQYKENVRRWQDLQPSTAAPKTPKKGGK